MTRMLPDLGATKFVGERLSPEQHPAMIFPRAKRVSAFSSSIVIRHFISLRHASSYQRAHCLRQNKKNLREPRCDIASQWLTHESTNIYAGEAKRSEERRV